MAQSDEEPYQQMRKGDQRAFMGLHERRERGLFRYALHLSSSRSVLHKIISLVT